MVHLLDLFRKMKILHIVNSYQSGVAHIINAIVAEGDKRDVQSALLYSDADDNVILPCETHYQIAMQREININKDWQALKKIKAVIKKFNPDVIHCHSAKAGVLGRIAARQLNIVCCYSPHCYAFLRLDVSWLKKRSYNWFEKIIAKYTQATTIAGGETEYQLARQFSNVTLINNSINLTEIIPPLINEKNSLIVTIGRLSPQKGIDIYKKVVQSLPADIQWLWIGDGEQKAQLASLNNVKVTGWLANDKVKQHLAAAKIYFQSSAWEGLPISVLEAASLAKPIVCSNIPGHRDIITPDNNGLLFNTVEQAAQAITTLLNNPQLCDQLGQAAYQTVSTNFNSQVNSPKYYLCYQNLLSSR